MKFKRLGIWYNTFEDGDKEVEIFWDEGVTQEYIDSLLETLKINGKIINQIFLDTV